MNTYEDLIEQGLSERESMIKLLEQQKEEITRLKEDLGLLQSIREWQGSTILKLHKSLQCAKGALKSTVGFEPFNSLEPQRCSEALKEIERIEAESE